MKIDSTFFPEHGREHHKEAAPKAFKDSNFNQLMQTLEKDMWPGAQSGNAIKSSRIESHRLHARVFHRVEDGAAVGGNTHVAELANGSVSISSQTLASATHVTSAKASVVSPTSIDQTQVRALTMIGQPTSSYTYLSKNADPNDADAPFIETSPNLERYAERAESPSLEKHHESIDRLSLLGAGRDLSLVVRHPGNRSEQNILRRTLLAELRRHGANSARLTINGSEQFGPTHLEVQDEH